MEINEPRKKIVFIVNPNSGRQSKTNWIAFATKMLAQTYDLQFQYTTHRGHATELTQKAVHEGVDIVTAVGGDGTVNEIAGALINTETALAILPLGSGNGLARDLGISPLLLFQAIETIQHAKTMKIDYGVANDIPFFCTCGIGFDAHISEMFASNKKRGFIKYAAIAIREYLRYKPTKCTLEYDGKSEERTAFIINCANIQQFGNNAFIAPKANFQDGLLNITIVKPFSFWGALRLAAFLFTKQINHTGFTETFTCKKITLKMPPKVPFQYDGEPTQMSNSVNIHVVKQGLKVVVP